MIALLLNAMLLLAHPIHTSVLELRWEAPGAGAARSMQGTLRVFEDDLRAASGDAGVTASAYVLRHLRVVVGGHSAAVATCGERRVADAVLICLRGEAPSPGDVRILNTILMDRHPDQVNIVRLSGACATTLLFTADAREQTAECMGDGGRGTAGGCN
jgi:hypothetical protein